MKEKNESEKFTSLTEDESKEILIPCETMVSESEACGLERLCASGKTIKCFTDVPGAICRTGEFPVNGTGEIKVYVQCGTLYAECFAPDDSGSGSGSGGEKPIEPTDPENPNGALL